MHPVPVTISRLSLAVPLRAMLTTTTAGAISLDLVINFLDSGDPVPFFLVTSACAPAFLGHSAPPPWVSFLDAVTKPTNYMRLSKKIIHRADDLTNLSLYNPVVREITTDFKPTYIPAKIVKSLAVNITNYIKVHITDKSEFEHSYYKPSSNKSSGSI
jgi:hypothetical protein